MSADEQTRVGTAERERALAALADHFAAGRLDSNEYEDRRGRAGDAVMRSDLDALFTDLPGGPAASGAVASPSMTRPGPASQPPMNRYEQRAERRGQRVQGFRAPQNTGQGVVALAPFVGLALFFMRSVQRSRATRARGSTLGPV